MHISRLDLNLLLVLDAIASAGSITAASRILNLTQPAVSHALARLRTQLDDPLFVRDGHSMSPTPYTRDVLPELRNILQSLEITLNRGSRFDPEGSDRCFTIAMHDSLEPWLLPLLMVRLQREAPNINLVCIKPDRRNMAKDLQSGAIDLGADVLLPSSEQILYAPLEPETLSIVVRADHPRVQKHLSLEQYLEERHVLVSSRSQGPGYEDGEIAKLGQRRKIALRSRNYLTACQVVANTDLLLTLPSRFAAQAQQGLGLNILPLPFDIMPITSYLFWHAQMDDNAAVRWLRDLVLNQTSS